MQINLGQKFEHLENRFDNMEGRFNNLEGRFDTLEGKFDSLEGRFDTLEGRFDTLDSSLHELMNFLKEHMVTKEEFKGLERRVDIIDIKVNTVKLDLIDRMDEKMLDLKNTLILRFSSGSLS